jgi:transcription elongation factor Elf1
MEFKKRDYLASHNRNMHLEKKSICDVCGMTFATEKILRVHKLGVHVTPTLDCDVCGKKLKTKSLLNSHKRSHEQKQFECHHCNKKFVNLQTITGHIEGKHMKYLQAMFKCDFCEKKYNTMRQKLDHERGHKGKGVDQFGILGSRQQHLKRGCYKK